MFKTLYLQQQIQDCMNLLCVQQLVAIAIDSFISTEYIELELAYIIETAR